MRVLVITAHADDLELSMGGTVRKFIEKGDVVDNVIMVDNGGRDEAIEKSTKLLGHKTVFFPKDLYEEDRPVMSSKLVADFEEWLSQNNFTAKLKEYDLIVTHWKEDWHQDHRTCYDLVQSLKRNQPIGVMYFDAIPYNQKYTNFDINVFFNVTNQMKAKMDAVEAFKDFYEMGLEERIKSYNFYRGQFIKVRFAECFKIENMIM